MTIEELERQLPNGFHDSQLVSLSTNFWAGSCCLELDVDYDDPDPDTFRRMKLQLSGVSLLVLEPPQAKGLLLPKDSIWASGYVTSERVLPNLESYRISAPPGTFFYSFFLHELNCFIRLGAKDASLEKPNRRQKPE
jgi:hypothetical protein